MPRLERVFVDTATLYPISLADLVLRLAELGMFELLWSDHLLAEVERVLVQYKGLAAEQSAYFCECIRRAFPDGRVAPEEYLPLVTSRRGPDPDDHVHSAAAVAGGATVVLSADKKGYPPADIAPARRRDPDAFLTELLRRYPQDVRVRSTRWARLCGNRSLACRFSIASSPRECRSSSHASPRRREPTHG